MDFDLAIDDAPQFMRVTVTGAPTLGQLLSMIHLLGVESETWQKDRVLVDLRRVVTPFDRTEQFRIGEEAAASLSHMDRIASLVPPERVTRVSEKAARRNGTNVRVFDREQEAVDWLAAGVAPSPSGRGWG
jgi:SpoIIAA-like